MLDPQYHNANHFIDECFVRITNTDEGSDRETVLAVRALWKKQLHRRGTFLSEGFLLNWLETKGFYCYHTNTYTYKPIMTWSLPAVDYIARRRKKDLLRTILAMICALVILFILINV